MIRLPVSYSKSLFLSLTVLCFCGLGVEAKPRFISPRVQLAASEGWCQEVPRQFSWPTGKPANLRTWISLCGPDKTGKIATAITQVFRAPPNISLYFLGFDQRESISVFLENVRSGAKLKIDPAQTPGGGWQLFEFVVPRVWRGSPVRIDISATGWGTRGWIGFSEPLDTGSTTDLKETLFLVLRLAEYFLLLTLPLFAASVTFARRGIAHPSLLVLFGLAGVAAAGYAAFWLWFLSPKVGHLCSFLLPLACAAYLVWIYRRLEANQLRAVTAIVRPWLLTFGGALFVGGAGFLFGGFNDPLATAQTRFSHQLPSDNYLPLLFAQNVTHGHVDKPMFIDWLSSDRPPLQTGLTLLAYPYIVAPRSLAYMLLGILLQSLWIPALWAFLKAWDFDRGAVVWTLVALLFSGPVLVNTFFVWPKLLAAAYGVAFSAILLSDRLAEEAGKRASVAVLAGTLLAFSLLAHGGSAFALLGLAITMLLLRKGQRWKASAWAASACVLLYVPWFGYQKLYDPPGDRLFKMHLAGVEKVDPRPFGTVLREAYSKLTRQQILETREANAITIFDHQVEYWRSLGQFVARLPSDLTSENKSAESISQVQRDLQFFYLFPSLGVFMTGPLLLLLGFARRRGQQPGVSV